MFARRARRSGYARRARPRCAALGWAHKTAAAARLDDERGAGAHPYEGRIASFSERWTAAADTAEAALDDAAAAEGVRASELSPTRTSTAASAAAYGLVDSEASVAGLVDDDGGRRLRPRARPARRAEPGFSEQHDRHAQFAREAAARRGRRRARGGGPDVARGRGEAEGRRGGRVSRGEEARALAKWRSSRVRRPFR